MRKLSLVAAVCVATLMSHAHAASLEITSQPTATAFATGDVVPVVRVTSGTPTLYQVPVTLFQADTSALTTQINSAISAQALLAPLASPALTGTPTAPTATAATSSTQIATTAYADSAVGIEAARAQAAETTNAASAAAAQTTASAALPVAGGTMTGAATFQGTSGKGIYIVNPNPLAGAGASAYFDFSSPMQNEFTLTNYAPLSNLFALHNSAPTGFTAETFRGYDYDLSTDTGTASDFEHGAFGYGPSLVFQMGHGYDFWEISRYDGAQNPYLKATPAIIQETGGVLLSFTSDTCSFTSGSTAVTCTTAVSASANGMMIDAPTQYGLIPAGTTIKSGQGTTSIVLSNPANGTRSSVTARYGTPTYHQYDDVFFNADGNIDFFKYSDAFEGGFSAMPFFSLDRANGRVGIYNNEPVAALDVLGNAVFGTTSTQRAQYAAGGVINAEVTAGSGGASQVIVNAFAAGLNRWQKMWLTGASRVSDFDVNANNPIFEEYMDGTLSARIIAERQTSQTAAYTLAFADCGTTVRLNSSSAITVTVPAALLTGCRVALTNLGAGTVTVAGASGETLEWNDGTTAYQTSYTLGEYASAVVVAQSSSTATVSSGQ